MPRKTHEDKILEYEERLYPVCKKLFARKNKGFEGTTKYEVIDHTRTEDRPAIGDKTIDKYFGGHSGLLTMVFRKGWTVINTKVRQAIEGAEGFIEIFKITASTAIKIFEQDQDLRTVFLLESRRTGKKGELVTMTQELLTFISSLDHLFKESQQKGEIKKEVNIEAMRSALFGAVEGMLRDRLYYERIGFPPANYSNNDILETTKILLESYKT